MSSTTPPPTDPRDEPGTSPPPPPSSEPTGAAGGPPPPAQPGTGPSGATPGQAPQGLAPSSIGKRIGAAAIDFIGLSIVLGVVLFPLLFASALSGASGAMPGFGGGFGTGYLFGLVLVALELAYFVLLEGSRGQTLGKMLLNMKVYKYDGGAMDMEAAFKRRFWFFIGSVIPFIGFLVTLGIVIWFLVTMSNDQMNRGYHDVFGDTIVVDET